MDASRCVQIIGKPSDSTDTGTSPRRPSTNHVTLLLRLRVHSSSTPITLQTAAPIEADEISGQTTFSAAGRMRFAVSKGDKPI
jgi:hypothetical protein